LRFVWRESRSGVPHVFEPASSKSNAERDDVLGKKVASYYVLLAEFLVRFVRG